MLASAPVSFPPPSLAVSASRSFVSVALGTILVLLVGLAGLVEGLSRETARADEASCECLRCDAGADLASSAPGDDGGDPPLSAGPFRIPTWSPALPGAARPSSLTFFAPLLRPSARAPPLSA